MKASDSCNVGVCDDVCEMNDMLQKMSTADYSISLCANCGKEGDNLKSCTACKLVKYCNRECQIAHRPQHKKECRRRVAELHDEKLFKEPPPKGDCPICFLRLPFIMVSGWRYFACCGKVICSGCVYAPVYDHQGNEVDEKKCPFCRTPAPYTQEEAIDRAKKRIEKDDAVAIHNQGNYYRDGRNGFPQDIDKALELWHRAGELGYAQAYCNIGIAYQRGNNSVKVDEKMAMYYYELGAMGGEVAARYNLGIREEIAGNMDRALKHYTITARNGLSDSLERVKELYSDGYATKENYTKALQSYQAYLSEIKSRQRDEAAAFDEDYRYY